MSDQGYFAGTGELVRIKCLLKDGNGVMGIDFISQVKWVLIRNVPVDTSR